MILELKVQPCLLIITNPNKQSVLKNIKVKFRKICQFELLFLNKLVFTKKTKKSYFKLVLFDKPRFYSQFGSMLFGLNRIHREIAKKLEKIYSLTISLILRLDHLRIVVGHVYDLNVLICFVSIVFDVFRERGHRLSYSSLLSRISILILP